MTSHLTGNPTSKGQRCYFGIIVFPEQQQQEQQEQQEQQQLNSSAARKQYFKGKSENLNDLRIRSDESNCC